MTCTSNRSQACLPSRAGSKRTSLVEGTMSLFLCHAPITRPAACGRSRRTSSSSGSSARRGSAPCESRKTVTSILFYLLFFFFLLHCEEANAAGVHLARHTLLFSGVVFLLSNNLLQVGSRSWYSSFCPLLKHFQAYFRAVLVARCFRVLGQRCLG